MLKFLLVYFQPEKRSDLPQTTADKAVEQAEEAGAAVVPVEKRPVVVEFRHVTKEYKLYKNDRKRVMGMFSDKVKHRVIRANDDLSFVIHKGESVALLGSNGAGKSTALKMITGVIYPTSGEVIVNGRVSALLELNAGFDAGLTGRENINMRAQIWGLSKEEIEELEPAVVKFADIGSYIDQPVRTYSSGMKARLGFAFASSINPDILIVDEALAVGDRQFARKCRKRVKKIMRDDNVTVLFVTHSTGAAKNFCERGIVMEHGRKIYDAPIDDAVAFYEGGDDEA